MTKFSIVVPIYQVESYLERSLNSLIQQTWTDFEVILVDDGSLDGSTAIAKDFANRDQRFHYFRKANGGLSDARNYGVEKARGLYLVFVDSDDYVESDLLQRLAEVEDNYDMIRFFSQEVDDNSQVLRLPQKTLTGVLNQAERYQFELVEAAWLYAYRRDFWLANQFQYQVGRLHEDFGLTPLALAKAEQVYAIDYIGYNYLQRPGSITSDPHKIEKRVMDIEWYFEQAKHWAITLTTEQARYYLNFMAIGVLGLVSQLSGAKRQALVQKIKKQQIYRYLVTDNFKQVIKKIIVWVSPVWFSKLAQK